MSRAAPLSIRRAHLIEDVSFSGLWCRCTCGVLVESENPEVMPEDWSAHRSAVGATGVNRGAASRDEQKFSINPSKRTTFSQERHDAEINP